MTYDRTLIVIRERSFLDLIDLALLVVRDRPFVVWASYSSRRIPYQSPLKPSTSAIE